LARKPKNEILFALDTPAPIPINPWESYLKGWFTCSLPHETMLGILLESSFVPAFYGLPRPDVAIHLNDPTRENSGFYIRFRTPKPGSRIKLVAQGESGRTVLAEATVPPAHPETHLFWPENEVSQRLAALPYHPLISVIVPTLNLDQKCVRSVHKQQYPHWELCESRADVLVRARPPGRAESDFIVTLDQNDELHPCALLEIVKRLNERPNCEVIYSDEDTIDAYGSRSHPVLKPDFDLDRFLAFNYLGRLVALKRRSVVALGEGAQGWDLYIRLIEKAGPAAVQHIAKPIYHRGAPAEKLVQKDLLRALSDHVQRTGKHAVVEPGIFPGSVRLKYVAPRSAAVAVFIRPEDGDFQVQTVSANFSRAISIHQFGDGDLPTADVFVFINRPLETLNHSFFEELTAQTLRDECGLVTGISVPSQLDVIKTVETIPPDFFAVRREHLTTAGGLTSISSGQTLLDKLTANAHQRGLRVLVTPFAVASFHSVEPTLVKETARNS
jgi:hypothetical protein